MCIRDRYQRRVHGEPDRARYSDMRPFTTNTKSTGKLAKGTTCHIAQFRPGEAERISELTRLLHESNDKIFHLKMELMAMKKNEVGLQGSEDQFVSGPREAFLPRVPSAKHNI
eukprot:TRINITY_DN6116_c0_g1_i1.p1 TRINITY_DN6116_c0_g1~~TRINITY_DN6116_c0_g1_i1.p1  ORF type:complete len:113 (+),score=19.80 TRINITY_DN6116_c0_g1_i1:166-504(+)